VVVDLVVGATAAAVSTAVAFMVADKLQVVLAPVEGASALVEREPKVVLRTLKARDHASHRLGIRRTHSLSSMVPGHKLRAEHSPGSRISVSRALETTLWRGMTRTGTTTGTDGMLTLTMVASLSLSTGFGAD
jgi:hypothetical protein